MLPTDGPFRRGDLLVMVRPPGVSVPDGWTAMQGGAYRVVERWRERDERVTYAYRHVRPVTDEGSAVRRDPATPAAKPLSVGIGLGDVPPSGN